MGVIGGGQLAKMMAAAAQDLHLDIVVQTPLATDPAVAVAQDWVAAEVADAQATRDLAQNCDVITFENEFVDLNALADLAATGTIFRPSLQTLSQLLDKYDQRQQLAALGLPTPRFATMLPGDDLHLGFAEWAFPFVLKTRRHGYDGQGTFVIKDGAMLTSVLAKLGAQPLLIEEFIPFTQELAVMVARSQAGEIVLYPVVETQQEQQVCRRVLAPAAISPQIQAQIEAIAHRWITALDGVGIFGIEFFLTADQRLLVNEIAPRTHNSGHYTIEACATSQFAQHLRAVSNLPLGKPDLLYPAALMVNLLGYESAESDYAAKRAALAAIPQATVHWYGKTQSRPGRKLGHVTVTFSSVQSSPSSFRPLQAEYLQVAHEIEAIWYEATPI